MITQTLKLNLIPGQVLPRVNVSQYDAGTRTLQMLLYNGDQAFSISSGMSGFVQGTKPDRTGFQYLATVTQGSNVVTLVITQQMTAVSGEVTCELVIADGDNRIATVNFIIYVEPAALADDTVISDTELPLIEEAAELAQRIDGIVADVEADADRAETAADNAELWASRNPYIGQNGNWFVFDTTTETFVDTGVSATGPQGPQGDDGPTGPQGPTGPTGNGIVSITKTGTSGLVDTYTILFTDGTTTTFTVTNGQDGQGSGDMTKAVYDSTNAVADAGGIVAYVAAHSGAGTLAGLDDVTLSSLAAGDTLVYNATTQKWENSTVIQTLTNQVNYNTENGVKNIIPYPFADKTGISQYGVTSIDNGDGTVTISGTNTSSTANLIMFRWFTKDEFLQNYVGKELTISFEGLTTAESVAYAPLIFYDTNGTEISRITFSNSNTHAEFTVTSAMKKASLRFHVNPSKTVNVTLKAMVCLKSLYDVDSSWEAPAKTNQLLTKETIGLIDNQNVNGVKNLCPNNKVGTSVVQGGLTWIFNLDGTVSVTGTNTQDFNVISIGKTESLKNGETYVISGSKWVPSGNCYIRVSKDGTIIADDHKGTPTSFVADGGEYEVTLYLRTVGTAYDVTFEPMICLKSLYDADPTYVPYAKSNKELTEDVAENSTQIQTLMNQANNKVLYLTGIACSATTGNFVSYSNSAITADHVVAECVFANPSAITTNATWTTASGSLTLNGTCSTATTVNVVLVKKDN